MPWAEQWAVWERLWRARRRVAFCESEASFGRGSKKPTTEEQNAVVRAAEEPRPVLFAEERGTPKLAKRQEGVKAEAMDSMVVCSFGDGVVEGLE